MASDALTADDADRMRDFADQCRRVAETAARIAEAETGPAVQLMSAVASGAQFLRTALLAAADHADPLGADEENDDDG